MTGKGGPYKLIYYSLKFINTVRLLIYSINYAPELTGIGKYSAEMAEWLVLQGHEVRVVAAPPYYPKWEIMHGHKGFSYQRERIKGVDVFRCPLYVPRKPSGVKRIFHLASFALSSAPVLLYQVFWKPDVSIVIEPPLFCSPMTLLIARISKSKSWLHIQDFEVDAAFELGIMSSHRLRRLVLHFEGWLMRKFDVVSTISSRMVDRLSYKCSDLNRIVNFPNWVDIDNIFPNSDTESFRDELGISQEKIVALYSGNMGEKQGLEIVIEAARILDRNKNVLFVLCGEGATYGKLRALATGLTNIVWIPLQPLEKLNDLLNMADIHLLPQRAGAADLVMPSKLTGMMASGKPVLSTTDNSTQIAEVLKGAGVVVPSEDLEAFVNGLEKLASDKKYRDTLGRNARAYAEQYLSRDSILSNFELELLELSKTDN